MRLILEAGTDSACVAIFDAVALPTDFDVQFLEDQRQAADDAQDNGQCFITDTGGDGTHILHIYVNEAIPGPLALASAPIRIIESFQIPSGRLWFTGAEYLCRDELLEPLQASTEERADIPKGTYAARLFEIDSGKISSPAPADLTLMERALGVARPLMLLVTVASLFLAIRSLILHGLSAETLYLTVSLIVASIGVYWLATSPTLRHWDEVKHAARREGCPNYILTLASTDRV